VERIEKAIRVFASVDDNEKYTDELYTLSSAFVKIAVYCPDTDLDQLGWELRVAYLRGQGRQGISSLFANAKQAMHTATDQILDAKNVIDKAGLFYLKIGHFQEDQS
jgi:hypothetical protein